MLAAFLMLGQTATTPPAPKDPWPKQAAASAILQRSLTGNVLLNGQIIDQAISEHPCEITIRAGNQIVKIDWSRVQPLYRSNDRARSVIIGENVLTTSERLVADRTEAAIAILSDTCSAK